MSVLRFYVDEDASERAVIDALRARGAVPRTLLRAEPSGTEKLKLMPGINPF